MQPRDASRPAERKSGALRRFAGALKLLGACLFVFATCGPSVDAQEDSPAAFFRADRERMQAQRQQARPRVVQRPTLMIRRAAPVRGYAREAPPIHRNTPLDLPARADPNAPPPAVTPGETVADAAALPAKPAEPAFTIAVIGDSLGQLLSQGLVEAYSDKPQIAILRKARENTGLVRDDYFDWVKGARDLAGGAEKISLVVMMAGSNDRQALREGGVSSELRSARWLQIYGDRVEAIAQAFRDRKIPVVWVGLPVMKNDRFSADMAAFNEVYKERASKTGAAFVDTWEPFLDDRGLFAAYGPDVNGQFQKLRSADGVHFTRPGARKLAYFLESEIRRALDDAKPKPEADIAALNPKPAPVDAAAPPLVPLPPPRGSGDPVVAVPLPPQIPAVVIPVKPAEGAVVALTAPALSPGGRLAAPARAAGAANDSQALVERVLVQGRPLDARPGRADDFSWPRR